MAKVTVKITGTKEVAELLERISEQYIIDFLKRREPGVVIEGEYEVVEKPAGLLPGGASDG